MCATLDVVRRRLFSNLIRPLSGTSRKLRFVLGYLFRLLSGYWVTKEERDNPSDKIPEPPRNRVQDILQIEDGLRTEREVTGRRFRLLSRLHKLACCLFHLLFRLLSGFTFRRFLNKFTCLAKLLGRALIRFRQVEFLNRPAHVIVLVLCRPERDNNLSAQRCHW